ncbi:MAG: hypothetical protein ACP5MX_00695 [Candidatus Micrarchaeia archaeon]
MKAKRARGRKQKARHRKKARQKKATASTASATYGEFLGKTKYSSYEEAVLSNILEGRPIHGISTKAMLFLNSLLNLSDGTKEIVYKRGFSIGKTLYKSLEARKHYAMYEESVKDLAEFFEKAGLGTTTFSAFSDKAVISIYGSDKSFMGANMHSFEAGIASGFISAARHEYSRVSETKCMHNLSDHCELVFSKFGTSEASAQDPKKILENAVRSLSNGEYGNTIRYDYGAMLANSALSAVYADELKAIAYYVGNSVASSMEKGKSRLESAIAIANSVCMENVMLEKAKPLKATISATSSITGKQAMELYASFMQGLLPKAARASDSKAIEINTYDFNKIKIAQAK